MITAVLRVRANAAASSVEKGSMGIIAKKGTEPGACKVPSYGTASWGILGWERDVQSIRTGNRSHMYWSRIWVAVPHFKVILRSMKAYIITEDPFLGEQEDCIGKKLSITDQRMSVALSQLCHGVTAPFFSNEQQTSQSLIHFCGHRLLHPSENASEWSVCMNLYWRICSSQWNHTVIWCSLPRWAR